MAIAQLRLNDQVVVTIMGSVAVELYNQGHQTNFLFLEHGMGLESSVELGIAVSLPKEKVTVLGGAGSVLMNLGSLSTLARYRPPNLTHWIFGNESLLSVGGFPSATGTGTDLAGIAEKAGAQHVVLADTVEAAEQAFAEASEPDGLSVIVSKVEPFGPPSSRWISICSRTALSSRVTFRAWQAYCGCDWAILPLDFASPSIDMLGYRRQTRCELEKKGARHEFQWQQKTLS